MMRTNETKPKGKWKQYCDTHFNAENLTEQPSEIANTERQEQCRSRENIMIECPEILLHVMEPKDHLFVVVMDVFSSVIGEEQP